MFFFFSSSDIKAETALKHGLKKGLDLNLLNPLRNTWVSPLPILRMNAGHLYFIHIMQRQSIIHLALCYCLPDGCNSNIWVEVGCLTSYYLCLCAISVWQIMYSWCIRASSQTEQ